MKKNTASQVVGCQLISKTDGSAVTAGTTTVFVTGDNGTQTTGSVGSGAATHKGHGYWEYLPAQAETNYDHVAFTFENSSGVNGTVQIYPSFPQTGDNYTRLGAPAGASVSADIAGVQSDTDNIQTRLPAALVSGRMDASVGAMAANVITAAATAIDFTTEVTAGLSMLDAAGVRAAVGLASANLDTQLTAIDDYIDTEVAAIKAKTDSLTFTTSGKVDATFNVAGDFPQACADKVWSTAARALTDKTGYSLAADQSGVIVGAVTTVLNGVMVSTNNDKTGYGLSASGSAAFTESYAADGAAATLPQLLYLILALLGEKAISGTTLTAKKLDGVSTAATFTLDDATTPSAITRAA